MFSVIDPLRNASQQERRKVRFFMKRWANWLLDKWKHLAHGVGVVNTHVLLFLAYWLVVGPAAVVLKVLRKDYLRIRWSGTNGSYWLDREPDADSLDRARYPF